MVRKAAMLIGVPALLGFMAWNAYLAINHLRQTQKIVALTVESSTIQADISGVLQDLTDMETGQRGYLLTDDRTYLKPYTQAKDSIAIDLARLRLGLENRSQTEHSLESQVESLATLKQAEMERSIKMREQGYRHRAFMLVASNEGMEYMDRARELLSSLAAAEISNFTRFESERNTSLRKALKETLIANACLLLLTACVIGVARYHCRVLEQEAAQSRQELATRDLQLEKLTSVLANQARSKTSALEANARLLLENYGGFLPRQGHEYAEQIKEASAQMERLRQDLLDSPGSNSDGKAA